MTEQRLIVDVTDIVLRLQCRCGSAVSIAPAKMVKDKTMKDAIYHCSNCEVLFPEIGTSHSAGRVSAFVHALQALAAADLKGCHVQFEIERSHPQP